MTAKRVVMAERLKGVYTALVTPFKKGAVDEENLTRLVEAQIAAGVEGVVPVGTTGESPTLNFNEHVNVIRLCVKAAAGKVTVLAGTGANSTQEAVELSEAAKEAGADGLLVVAPYYNKPTQRGLISHYRTLLERVDLPLVIYNIPGRTGVNVEPETFAELASSKRLAGVKEAAGNADQVSRILALCGPDFPVLSGDDSLTLPFMSVGARGVISVASNVVPREVGAMVRAFLAGRPDEALDLHRKLFPLFRALFIETNPIPVKTALNFLGLCSAEMRLPMTAMAEGNAARLRKVMKDFGLKV